MGTEDLSKGLDFPSVTTKYNPKVKVSKPYRRGSTKAVQILERHKFDPISKLVAQYEKLEKELEIQERLRDGTLAFLDHNGKASVKYSQYAHYMIYDKLAKIAADLLSYRYGKVKEDDPSKSIPKAKALIVELTDDNGQYIINQDALEVEEEENDDVYDDTPDEEIVVDVASTVVDVASTVVDVTSTVVEDASDD